MTVFLIAPPVCQFISSSTIRELAATGRRLSQVRRSHCVATALRATRIGGIHGNPNVSSGQDRVLLLPAMRSGIRISSGVPHPARALRPTRFSARRRASSADVMASCTNGTRHFHLDRLGERRMARPFVKTCRRVILPAGSTLELTPHGPGIMLATATRRACAGQDHVRPRSHAGRHGATGASAVLHHEAAARRISVRSP